MAFPFIFESNFEGGSNAEWDDETDTVSQLDFPSFRELARFPWSRAIPSSGAYCMRATLSGGTADAFVQEGDMNIAADGTAHVKFDIYFSPTFDATADDTVNVLELQETGNAAQVTFGFRYVASTDVINFGIGKAAPTSFGSENIERNRWYTVEIAATLDDGGSNDGTIDLYVTKIGEKAAEVVHATQVASLDQSAVTHGVLGVQDHLATTTGVILFDNLVMDDARVYPRTEEFPREKLLTKSGAVFVGAGEVSTLELLSGAGTDNALTVYDTSVADTNDASNIVAEVKNTANNELVPKDLTGGNIKVRRGCYVALSGTNPRALIKITRAGGYGSYANVRDYGAANGSNR